MTPDGWLRTGDVAKASADGFVTLVDRATDVIKSGGEWVSSVDLDNADYGSPQRCGGGGHRPEQPGIWQERPVAYMVARPEFREALTADDIRNYLNTRVAKWWPPDEVRFVNDIPSL